MWVILTQDQNSIYLYKCEPTNLLPYIRNFSHSCSLIFFVILWLLPRSLCGRNTTLKGSQFFPMIHLLLFPGGHLCILRWWTMAGKTPVIVLIFLTDSGRHKHFFLSVLDLLYYFDFFKTSCRFTGLELSFICSSSCPSDWEQHHNIQSAAKFWVAHQLSSTCSQSS